MVPLETILNDLRKTSDSKFNGLVRLMLGFIFLSTGIMKFTFPALAAAWSGQLIQAKIPLFEFNLVFVPSLEIILGLTLLFGFSQA